jgi:hypothetical protein
MGNSVLLVRLLIHMTKNDHSKSVLQLHQVAHCYTDKI